MRCIVTIFPGKIKVLLKINLNFLSRGFFCPCVFRAVFREENPDVSNEMDNVFHDREGVCPMDAMRKLAEV